MVTLREATKDGTKIGIEDGKENETTEAEGEEEDATLGLFWSVVFPFIICQ